MRFLLGLVILLTALPALADGGNFLGLRKPVGTCGFLNTSSTNVTTSAWVTIVASTGSAFSAVLVSNSGASPLKLAVGSAGNEVDTGLALHPASQGGVMVPLNLAKNLRLSLEALGATQSSGYVTICFFQ